MSIPANYLQPAQQSQLSKEAEGFFPVYTSPSQGLILRASEWNLPLTSAAALNNLRWDGIRWTTQNIGFVQQRSALFNSGAQFYEFGVHNMSDGTSRFIQQVGKQVQLYDPTTPGYVESVLFTATAASIPCMRSFSPNYFIYTNGVDHPQHWDGTTWSALSLFPVTQGSNTFDYATYCESFNNRVAYAGFAGQPYAVLISDFGAPNSCTLTGTNPVYGGIYFVPSELGPITSLRVIRLSQLSNQQALMVGCQKGLCFINGTDSTNFVMITATKRFGIPSNRCWFAIDDSTYALCTDGIRPFNANTTFSNLIAQANSFPVQPLLQSMSTNAALQAQAFVLDNPGQLEATFYYTSNSDVHNRVGLIMNYSSVYGGSMVFSQKQFPIEVAGQPLSIYSPACGVAYKGAFYCGGFNGLLQTMYTSNMWNGVGIAWNYLSPMLQPGNPSLECSARGFWIQLDGLGAPFTAQAYVWRGMALDQNISRNLTTTQTLSPTTNGTTILGSWVLGTGVFGGSQPQVVPFYPAGAGKAWQIALSGNTANGDAALIGIFGTLQQGGTRQ
jgi:hypothetical protein